MILKPFRRYFFSQKVRKERKIKIKKKSNIFPDHDPRDYHSPLHSRIAFPKEKKKKKEKKRKLPVLIPERSDHVSN